MMLQHEEKFVKGNVTRAVIEDTLTDVFDVVCSTMGPDGNVVVIQEGTLVKTTKDGATVARSLEFENFHQDKINQIIAEAARKTELECGDGTTTTIFLTKLYYDLFKKYPGFINRKHIEKLTAALIEVLKADTVHVQVGDEQLRQVATVTANQDKSIVDTVLRIYDNYENPMIELAEGTVLEDKVSKRSGQMIRLRMADPMFSQDGNGSTTQFGAMVWVVVNAMITNTNGIDIGKLIEDCITISEKGKYNVGLVFNQASTQFCQMIGHINHNLKQNNHNFNISVFSTNMGGSLGSMIMGDIATVLNSTMIPSLESLGSTTFKPCEDVVEVNLTQGFIPNVSQNTLDRIEKRAEDVRLSLEDMSSENRYSPLGRATEKRLAELTGSVVTIYVGGETMSDIKERKDRFEDVALAVKSALTNGILPGCGMALRDAMDKLFNSDDDIINTTPADLLEDFYCLCFKQWKYLTGQDINEDATIGLLSKDVEDRVIVDLATGKQGTPEQLGIYDTAYASITALKGGMTTAKILANTSSIILGNRSGAVYFDNKR